MRALKILVVVMGIMLVGGTVALIVAVINRTGRPISPQTASAPPGHGFERSVVDLPEGARMLGTELAGERILLRVALADGNEELIVLDLRSGTRLGTFELRPGSAAGKP